LYDFVVLEFEVCTIKRDGQTHGRTSKTRHSTY